MCWACTRVNLCVFVGGGHLYVCVYVYVYCSIVYVCVCVCVCVHVCMCMREERERKGKPPLLSYHCFLLQYDRKYESSDEQTERLGIFIKNLQYIMQANSMEGRSFQCETTDQQWHMTSFPHPPPITPALTLTHHPSTTAMCIIHSHPFPSSSHPSSLLLPTHPPSSRSGTECLLWFNLWRVQRPLPHLWATGTFECVHTRGLCTFCMSLESVSVQVSLLHDSMTQLNMCPIGLLVVCVSMCTVVLSFCIYCALVHCRTALPLQLGPPAKGLPFLLQSTGVRNM